MKAKIGDRVKWADSPETYTVWAMHPKPGWWWILRDGSTTAVPARAKNLRITERAASPSAQERKAEGMAQALAPDAISEWKDAFRAQIGHRPSGDRFTSEDVLAVVGLPTGEIGMNANNAVGAMMNGLARKGIITKTGLRVTSRRSSSHGAEIIVWERV